MSGDSLQLGGQVAGTAFGVDERHPILPQLVWGDVQQLPVAAAQLGVRRPRRAGPCAAGMTLAGGRVRGTRTQSAGRRGGGAAHAVGPRFAIQASITWTVSGPSGTMRSESSLPTGTRSQVP